MDSDYIGRPRLLVEWHLVTNYTTWFRFLANVKISPFQLADIYQSMFLINIDFCESVNIFIQHSFKPTYMPKNTQKG